MSLSFEGFIDDVRGAVGESDPDTAIRSVLMHYVSNPDPIISATPEAKPEEGEDELILYQDEDLSIWRCRFEPYVTMQPHENKLTVHIAVYSGGEKNILLKRQFGVVNHDRIHIVKTGEVSTMDEGGG